MLIENIPRPYVAATSVSFIQNNSSTAQFVGPSLLADQLCPPFALAKTPTSVPTYKLFVFCCQTASERTGALGRLAVMLDHAVPLFSVRQTLSALNPPKVT
jgi:hypothetical protein